MIEPLTDAELAQEVELRKRFPDDAWPGGTVDRLLATIDALTAERDSLEQTKLNLSDALFALTADRDRYREELRQIKAGGTYDIVSNVAITEPEER